MEVKSMDLKCGRTIYKLTEKDIIVYNGNSYTLITRHVGSPFKNICPTVAKPRATKLIKDGLLKAVKLDNPPYKSDKLVYYKISE